MVYTTSDFTAGDRVIFVPDHVDGDVFHEDCRHGTVYSCNKDKVFVRYTKSGMPAQAHDPNCLVKNEW